MPPSTPSSRWARSPRPRPHCRAGPALWTCNPEPQCAGPSTSHRGARIAFPAVHSPSPPCLDACRFGSWWPCPPAARCGGGGFPPALVRKSRHVGRACMHSLPHHLGTRLQAPHTPERSRSSLPPPGPQEVSAASSVINGTWLLYLTGVDQSF